MRLHRSLAFLVFATLALPAHADGPVVAPSTYRVVKDETSALAKRSVLKFAGAGVSCADDSGGKQTTCTIGSNSAGSDTADTTAVNNALVISRHVHYEAPITADTTTTVALLDPVASGGLTVAAQPDFPRKLTLTITDANSSITAGTIAFVGVGTSGQALSQTIDISNGGTHTYTTTDAFATITSITAAGITGAASGDTVKVGPATALGLPGTYSPTCGTFVVYKSNVTNANETVGTVDATAGTIVPTTAPNGTRTYDFWYRCSVTVTQTAHHHTQQ